MLPVMRMFARMLGRAPLGHLLYLLRQLRYERPHRFGNELRINSFFPPYPSIAFDRFCDAVIHRRRLPYSAYVAVTSACPHACAHCSYAGRADGAMHAELALDVVRQLKDIGCCTVGFTGGEPLLYGDLERLIAAARPEMAAIVFTTGHGLNASRARRLAEAGATCVTIGVEFADAARHDAVRGGSGSFAVAEQAAAACRDAGLYLALSTVATREKIESGELDRLYDLSEAWGALELRVLSPVATGAWVGCGASMLSAEELAQVRAFHMRRNRARRGPAVASFARMESDELFGCGAGFHHVFIDADGCVCPCDLTPLSFGNVAEEPLRAIWRRMAEFFPLPRRGGCLMGRLTGALRGRDGVLPLSRDESEALCRACLPKGEPPEGHRRLLRGRPATDPAPARQA